MTDLDDRILGYAGEAVDDCSPDRITAVTRFESGNRHAVYKVSYLDPAGSKKDVVVRVSLGNDVGERAQAEREAAVMTTVQGMAAPVLHDARTDSRWFGAPAMCMQFVPGAQRELAVVSPKDLERLGSVVAWVHGRPVDDLAAAFPSADADAGTAAEYAAARVQQVIAYLPAVRDPLPASLQHRLRRAVEVTTASLERAHDGGALGGVQRLVLLHGDVSGGNVIWGEDPVLIDWEYARLGDPADEIAYLFSQNGLAEAQRQAFWRGYLGGAAGTGGRAEQLMARVRWWEPVTLLGSALWWIERWSRRVDADAAGDVDPSAPRPPRDYLDHALARLDRFDGLC